MLPEGDLRLVLFDGVCAFCDASVRWLMDRDPEGRLRFAPLQGPTAAALRARHPDLPDALDGMVYVERIGDVERVYTCFDAIRRCAAQIAAPGWLRWLTALPRPIGELGYRIFARLRYAAFGRRDACRVPTPAERARFLE